VIDEQGKERGLRGGHAPTSLAKDLLAMYLIERDLTLLKPVRECEKKEKV